VDSFSDKRWVLWRDRSERNASGPGVRLDPTPSPKFCFARKSRDCLRKNYEFLKHPYRGYLLAVLARSAMMTDEQALRLIEDMRRNTRHGDVVALLDWVLALVQRQQGAAAAPKADRRTYMREYMRRKRAAKT
jgi:hypothetical protein